ncbi:MAG: replicative DNA helicase [Chloroflexota bacterium]
MAMGSRTPPHNLEAEQAVLGSILLDHEQLGNVDLDPDDFFDEGCRFIFQAIRGLFERGEGIDQITVAHELRRMGKLEQVGGAASLVRLVEAVPTSLHAGYYGRVVKDCALNRKIIVAAGAIARAGYEGISPLDALQRSYEALGEVGRAMPSQELLTPTDLADRANERYEGLRNRVAGLATGVHQFDARVGGLYPGDLVILAARPGVGKSTFALQVAERMAERYSVLFVSLEMTVNSVTDKRVAWLIGKPVRVVRRGGYDEDTLDLITRDGLGMIRDRHLYLCHAPMTTRSLHQFVERMSSLYGLDIVFVDYLQLLNDHYGTNANERIGYISRELANMSKEFNVPFVVLSQLSRVPDARMDKRPHLSDLRESGSIEQDADVVIFMYRDSYYDHKQELHGAKTEILIGKARLGEAARGVEVYWDVHSERYVNNERELTIGREGHKSASK